MIEVYNSCRGEITEIVNCNNKVVFLPDKTFKKILCSNETIVVTL